MSSFSTPAIMLRRIDHGDYDFIITFITLDRGKISVIAKYAKKSAKRFPGILELFSVLHVVCKTSRGLPVLQEAALKYHFSGIRADIKKTAYASYWAELINNWLEEGNRQTQLYRLFQHVLSELDFGYTPAEALSALFQMRFMTQAGFCPNLQHCNICRLEMEKMKTNKVLFDLEKGGLVCERCALRPGGIQLSKGTIKQLLWLNKGDFKKASRVRFAPAALKEALDFLEAFVPYHLGRETRSLNVLRQIRR